MGGLVLNRLEYNPVMNAGERSNEFSSCKKSEKLLHQLRKYQLFKSVSLIQFLKFLDYSHKMDRF
jgi:hypothetical protein